MSWGLKRTGRLKSRSARRTKFMREVRVPLTRQMLAEDDACEVGRLIANGLPFIDTEAMRKWKGTCRGEAIGLHEIKKRSQGGSMTDRPNLLRTCAPCNSWIEDNPALARTLMLVRRAGD